MAAGMCYTSATTGDPKGVLYSHRSTFLHAMAGCMVNAGAMGEREVALPAVPMFHVNAWGMPYSCTMTGAKQVFPGSGLIGQPLAELLEAERVTCAAGVPTIWTLLYQHLKEKRYDLSSLHTLLVGGSAASRAMIENFQRDFGIRVLHAWGMTETSPLGTVSRLKAAMLDWPEERQLDVRLKQGIPMVGGRDPDPRRTTARTSPGTASTSASWPCAARGSPSSYYNNPEAGAAFTADGWFRTGDMASIDRYGYVQLSDRKKDLIKRKGEWISSVDMENAVARPSGRARGRRRRAGPTRSATRCPPSSSSGATTRIIRSSPRTSSTCSPASSPSGSCPSPRTSTSSTRSPRRASARSTRRSCASSWPTGRSPDDRVIPPRVRSSLPTTVVGQSAASPV